MSVPLNRRLARAVTALALAVPLAVTVAGAAPVAAGGASPTVLCTTTRPNVWALPGIANPPTYVPGQTRLFTVSIRNNSTCSLTWSTTSFHTSYDGHVWKDGPSGPASGSVAPGATVSTSYLLTAPQYPFGPANFYIYVNTNLVNTGFHWQIQGTVD